MKRLIPVFLLVVAVSIISVEAFAQLRPIRFPQGDAQIRRNNRIPAGQRGINRPLGGPQLGPRRGVNPNQLRKQQLQQRVMQAIGLSPDQRMRMQEIRRSHDDEVIAAGRRLRQARQALDRAIMSEPYNEGEVRRATEALATAQAEKIRLDSRVRAQVRGVLTPEQVVRFHQLQRDMRRDMREQQTDQKKEPGPRGMTEPDEIDLISLL
jgi:Spy/CpxP family protein refolding chaperone